MARNICMGTLESQLNYDAAWMLLEGDVAICWIPSLNCMRIFFNFTKKYLHIREFIDWSAHKINPEVYGNAREKLKEIQFQLNFYFNGIWG